MANITKSPWIIHYDGSSCNGCDIEVLACLTPLYDIERFGIINTGNPKHADIFLITGGINHQNVDIVKNNDDLYRQDGEGPLAEFEYVDQTPVSDTDFYYVRVTQIDEEMAWSSPIWVTTKK